MSALSIQPTYPIFTDIDGQPLEDGYIWIGVANLAPIVNPITVYWDAALTIPAVQPIRTRGGYPINSGTPARLYVNSNYSIQVQNRNGSVVYSAPTATERYNEVVLTGINAADVLYDPAGTGAVQTTVQQRLRQQTSVFDFMTAAQIADVQANTALLDVTAAIQKAFDHAGNNGGAVFFPSGTYRTSAVISMPSSNVWVPFIVQGSGDSIIKSTHNGAAINGMPSQNWQLRGMQFDGPGTGSTSSTGFLGSLTQGSIEYCQFKNYYKGINIDNTIMAYLNRVIVTSCEFGIHGVETTGTSFMNLINITNTWVSNCNVGIKGQTWFACTMTNVVSEYNTTYGGQFTGMSSLTMDAVWCEGNPSGDMQFTDSLVTFTNCRFSAGQPTFIYTGGWGGLPKTRVSLSAGQMSSGYLYIEAHNGTTGFVNVAQIQAFDAVSKAQVRNTNYLNNIQLWNFNPTDGSSVTPGEDGLLNLQVNSVNDIINLELLNDAYPNSGLPTLAFSNWGAGNGYSPKLKASFNNILFQGGGGFAPAGSGYFAPENDGGPDLGDASLRWDTVYAVTPAINTSDANEKQQVRELTDAERATATAIKGIIRAFKFNSAVAEKGDDARIHFGVIAQDVQQAFAANGLDASKYGLFCVDTWNEYNGRKVPVDADGKFVVVTYTLNGEPVRPDKEGKLPEGAVEHVEKLDTVQRTRLGVRYEELLSFVITAL
ncbi:Intramolecular chaperone auto-processing domain containing protein [uncultured Caudovirales phage]|uniref:Intramolecular chaperone auto-processing domain containing protein n=1 Tax=uncultured Caudovirales phage TaxID=2100421 RepID=A0A6J5M7K3_9CAUD|nr:Intramolecular chaperone auto-processing domain containing protein [uncultured Caudovirales phage]